MKRYCISDITINNWKAKKYYFLSFKSLCSICMLFLFSRRVTWFDRGYPLCYNSAFLDVIYLSVTNDGINKNNQFYLIISGQTFGIVVNTIVSLKGHSSCCKLLITLVVFVEMIYSCCSISLFKHILLLFYYHSQYGCRHFMTQFGLLQRVILLSQCHHSHNGIGGKYILFGRYRY